MPPSVTISPDFNHPEFYVDSNGAIRTEPFAQVSQLAWAVPGQSSFAEVGGQENLYPFRPQYLKVGDAPPIRALVFQDQALARQVTARLGGNPWREGYQLVLFSNQADPSFTGYALAPMASGASLAFTGQIYLPTSGRINGVLEPLYQGLATLLGMQPLAVEVGLITGLSPIPLDVLRANSTERIENAYQALNHPAAVESYGQIKDAIDDILKEGYELSNPMRAWLLSLSLRLNIVITQGDGYLAGQPLLALEDGQVPLQVFQMLFAHPDHILALEALAKIASTHGIYAATDHEVEVARAIFLLEALSKLSFSAYYQRYSANPPALYWGVLRRLPTEALPQFVELFDIIDDIWEYKVGLPYPNLTRAENVDKVWQATLSAMAQDDDLIAFFATEEGLSALQYLQQELQGPPVDSRAPHPMMDEFGEDPLPMTAPERGFDPGQPAIARAAPASTLVPGAMPPLRADQAAFPPQVVAALTEAGIPERLWPAVYAHIGENPFASPELFNRMDTLLREHSVPSTTLDSLRSLAESRGLLEHTDRLPGGEGRGK
ncbi:MAG: hypothetical protein HYU97_07870 [Deltaproteobacteria bacterium]|nr:hypothetical protein [Deltaproteobacteria bacterium]